MKIAIVGAGAMSLRFLDAVNGNLPDVEFVAVHDIQQVQLDFFKDKYSQIQAFSNYEDMLQISGADAVYISTPVNTHPDLVEKAAKQGKHILCEKPMAITLAECESMVAAAVQNQVVLQIGYMMRFHPYHQYIRQQIESGVLGRIRFAHVERTDRVDFKSGIIPAHRMWFVNKSVSGGGAFMDLGCHLLDLLLYLLDDKPVEYSLAGTIDRDLGVELSGLASLHFEGGAAGTVFASWQVPLHDNLLQIYGESASIQAMRTIGPYKDSRLELIRDGVRSLIELPYRSHYVAELEHFKDCVRDGVEPITSGRRCLRSELVRIGLLEQIA